MRSRLPRIVLAGLLAGVACATSVDGPSATCDAYPIEWQPLPDSQARAQGALDLLAAEVGSHPVLQWSAPRGTFTAVYGLSYPLAACSAATDGLEIAPRVEDEAWALFARAPDLFPLRRSEWEDVVSVRCRDIDANTVTFLTRRRTLDGEPETQDVFLYFVRRVDGVVRLESVLADYLPLAPTPIAASLHACGSLDPRAAEDTARRTGYQYNVFDTCYPVGRGIYSPRRNDAFILEPDTWWEWREEPGKQAVLLEKRQHGRLTVDPSNWTSDLVNSDAFCLDSIGWIITFDAVLGPILVQQPGLQCIVC